MFKHGSLFSGIGGFDLSAEWMGWENIFHCEWNPFGQKVLKYYWPKAISYNDIKTTDFTIHRGRIDILTGGFPCQPYSQAGKRLGKEDERHLWPEMLRAIREIQPRYVVGENVRGLTNWNGGVVFDQVQSDLEAEGYEVLPFLLPACAVGAPHRRDRIWFVAYNPNARVEGLQQEWKNRVYGCENVTNADRDGRNGSNGEHEEYTSETGFNALNDTKYVIVADSNSNGLQGSKKQRVTGEVWQKRNKLPSGFFQSNWQNFPTQSTVCSGNDGFPSNMDGITFPKYRQESIMAYGNAIVPQVAYQIFKAIQQTETNV